MKKIVYVVIFIIQFMNISSVLAQDGIEWGSCLGAGGYSASIIDNACKTPDGGYILVGEAIDSGFWSPYFMGVSDFGVIRFDSVGNLLWKKTYGGNAADRAYCVIKGIRPNRYYIAGVSRSESSINYHSPSNYGDAWLIAIDSLGNQIWNRCYGGYQGESFYSLMQLADSNQIYGIGLTGSPSNSGDVSMNYSLGGLTTSGWICKINTNTGMLIKEKVYGGTNNDFLDNSAMLNNTQFLVQGSTSSRDHDVWTHYGNGQTSANGWLLNIDTSLNIVWQKTIGSSGSYGIINDVLKTQDGGIAVYGSTVNRPGDTSCFTFYVDTLPPYGQRKQEAYIIKYDSLGNELWQQHYGAPLDAINLEGRFVQMQDGGFVFSTTVSKWHGFAQWPYSSGSVLFKTDSAGNLLSTSRYGQGIAPLNTKTLFTTNQNKLVIVSEKSPLCPASYPVGGWCIFQIGHQLSIDDNKTIELPIQIYPNPSTGIFNIDFENSIKQITVYNTLGQIVKTVSTKQAIKTYKLDLSGNSKGLYFIGIEMDNNMIFKKVVLE